MDDVINEAVFRCLDCSKEFMVIQGSKRRFCDACTVKRMSTRAKRTQKGGKK